MSGQHFAQLNAQGRSLSQIAAEYGITRNAVAGAIFRARNGNDARIRLGGRRLGEQNPQAKMTADTVRAMRHLRERGIIYTELAEMFGVSVPVAWSICERRTWKHVA